jgi:hypothetical protein
MGRSKEEGAVMRRRNTLAFARIALVVLAVAAIMPTTATAKPSPRGYTGDSESEYPAWATEMKTPYWFSQQVGMNPDDRPLVRSMNADESGYPAWATKIQTPYWFSQPIGLSSDDRSFSRATTVDSTPSIVVHDSERSIDFNAYTVTGLVSVLLLALGVGMAAGVVYSRRTRLSPA